MLVFTQVLNLINIIQNKSQLSWWTACKFVTKRQADPEAVTQWLGQSIDVLESEEMGACLFKVQINSRFKKNARSINMELRIQHVMYVLYGYVSRQTMCWNV